MRGAVVLAVAAALLFSAVPPPVSRASVSTAYWLWWDYAIWGSRYLGNQVTFDAYIYNTNSAFPNDLIMSVQLNTPWGSYADTVMPVNLCYGCSYKYEVTFTIPATASLGNAGMTLAFSGRYGDGSLFCQSTGNVCTSNFNLYIIPDPYALQTQVTSMQQTITNLNTNITSLRGQVSTLQGEVTSLQTQLTTAKGNITTLKTSLATASSALTTAKASLTTAQASLATAQATLTSTQAELASTKSSLNTVSSVYLPVGVAIPSVLAALFLFLYLRKKPRQSQL
jgi:hypothetical protein